MSKRRQPPSQPSLAEVTTRNSGKFTDEEMDVRLSMMREISAVVAKHAAMAGGDNLVGLVVGYLTRMGGSGAKTIGCEIVMELPEDTPKSFQAVACQIASHAAGLQAELMLEGDVKACDCSRCRVRRENKSRLTKMN